MLVDLDLELVRIVRILRCNDKFYFISVFLREMFLFKAYSSVKLFPLQYAIPIIIEASIRTIVYNRILLTIYMNNINLIFLDS